MTTPHQPSKSNEEIGRKDIEQLMLKHLNWTPRHSGATNDFIYEVLSLLETKDAEREKAVEEERESKNSAYRERDMLVCALSKVFPAYLARHDEADTEWENDWRWIVYIDLPAGKMLLPTGNLIDQSTQVSWHIHDSEREMFNHLEVRENNWDGHNTERKYQRLMALQALTPPQVTSKE